jgi:hypothetical protein
MPRSKKEAAQGASTTTSSAVSPVGVVDDETQRNDLMIIRQVAGVTDNIPNARAYDFSFAFEADQQLNRGNWRP